MIPYLYDSTETNFDGKCICRLAESTYCVVYEERNGMFECEFEYPVGGKYFSELQIGRYIACTHDDQRDIQPFRIYRKTAPMNGLVTFYAHHLSYKLSRIILNPFTATTAAEAFYKIPSESINNNPFTFWTDKSGSGSFKVEVPSSVRSILGGTDGSILDSFGGGEYKFDNWIVRLYSERGTNSNVTVRYGKNLRDINHDVDAENIYNAIIPYWKGRSEEAGDTDIVVMLDERIVADSSVTNPQAIPVDFSSDFQEQPTQDQLRQRATSYLTNNDTWVPKENIKIDFVQLWQTDEYKDVASLQRVNLCDTVNVYHPDLGVTANNVKVVKTTYNVLLDRYDKMELGATKTNFIENIEANYDEQIKKTAKGFEAILKAEIDYATKLLTNPGDSHVVFVGIDEEGNRVYGSGVVPNPQEILVMNSTDPATATEILRINKNGIGFANNINGPYRSAWTLDGHFIADFITAGTINGNLIRTGMISDYNTSNTFVLTSDTSVQTGKAYYSKAPVASYDENAIYSVGDLVRYNGTVYKCRTAITAAESWNSSHWTTATDQDYTYVVIKYPIDSEIRGYYELQNTHRNYWNLETGEFSLAAATTIGGKTATTIASDAVNAQTQEFVFKKLTNNGTIEGIYMQGGQLYINANYIKSGYIESNRIKVTDFMEVQYGPSDLSGKLGAGFFYKTKSGASSSDFICRGVGLSADGGGNDYSHGVIAIDFDNGGIYLKAPTIYIEAYSALDINGVQAGDGDQKVITNIYYDDNGVLQWSWKYIHYSSGLVTGIDWS